MKQMVKNHKILDMFGNRLDLNADNKFELDGEELGGGGGGSSDVTVDDIDSGTATQGQVLTADGNGGASWENVGGNKMYIHSIAIRIGSSALASTTHARFQFICNRETSFTSVSDLSKKLSECGYKASYSYQDMLNATGLYINSNVYSLVIAIGGRDDGTRIGLLYFTNIYDGSQMSWNYTLTSPTSSDFNILYDDVREI